VALGGARQHEGQRFGGRVQVFAGGVFGLALGAAGGSFDDFAEGGYEMGGLLAAPMGLGEIDTCPFLDYVLSEETLFNNLGLTNGEFREHWVRGGIVVNRDLRRIGSMVVRLSGGPDLIWRVTDREGRKTVVVPEPHVLAIHQRETGLHLGGKAFLSLLSRRGSVHLSVENRPRRGPDLHWAVLVGFSL